MMGTIFDNLNANVDLSVFRKSNTDPKTPIRRRYLSLVGLREYVDIINGDLTGRLLPEGMDEDTVKRMITHCIGDLDAIRVMTIQTPDPPAHEYVDLGLPSGTLWATDNIKDTNGNELYFAWGETTGYTTKQVEEGIKAFRWNDYKFGSQHALRKYNETDELVVLEPEDDAATQNWGTEWMMPTKEQFEELLEGTNQEWTEVNGVQGLLCTSKTNGNIVFFTAAGDAETGGGFGCYWTVSLDGMDVYRAWTFDFHGGIHDIQHYGRCYGYSVRPVCVKKIHGYIDLGLPSGTLWATENIKDTDGNELYFAWGDTIGYTVDQVQQGIKGFRWNDYKFGPPDALIKYNETDGLTVLEPEDDAATQNWGAGWKMPTKEQFEELLEGTDQEWKEVNGIQGLLCTSKTNRNTVFFAAVGYAEDGEVHNVGDYGYYWLVSMNAMNVGSDWSSDFSDGILQMSNNDRYCGYYVRPVRIQNE